MTRRTQTVMMMEEHFLRVNMTTTQLSTFAAKQTVPKTTQLLFRWNLHFFFWRRQFSSMSPYTFCTISAPRIWCKWKLYYISCFYVFLLPRCLKEKLYLKESLLFGHYNIWVTFVTYCGKVIFLRLKKEIRITKKKLGLQMKNLKCRTEVWSQREWRSHRSGFNVLLSLCDNHRKTC